MSNYKYKLIDFLVLLKSSRKEYLSWLENPVMQRYDKMISRNCSGRLMETDEVHHQTTQETKEELVWKRPPICEDTS